MNIFGPARIDPNVPVEETVGALKELVEEGRIGAVRAGYPQAYAPLGYGFLTGQVKKLEDIPKGDIRHMFGRFQPQNFPKNFELVDKVSEFAKRRGVTPAQLALAWIRAHSHTAGCGVIIPIPRATAASRVEENSKVVPLSAEEKEQLDSILRSFNVHGERQIPGMESILWT